MTEEEKDEYFEKSGCAKIAAWIVFIALFWAAVAVLSVVL